jgi:hypothetical protein
MFAFVCYVSIHLEISATVMRSAPEELSIRIRTISSGGCGIGQGSVAKTEEAGGMPGSCLQMSQVCGLWSNDGQSRSYPKDFGEVGYRMWSSMSATKAASSQN